MKKKSVPVIVVLYALMIFLFVSYNITDNYVYFFQSTGSPMGNTLIFLGLLWFCQKTCHLLTRPRSKLFYFFSLMICAFFSLASLLGIFYDAEVGIGKTIDRDIVNLFRMGLAFVAGIVTFFALIQLVCALRELPKKELPFDGLNRFVSRLFARGCFWKSLVILTVCWLPQVLIRYPGSLTTDTIVSLKQYWGMRPMNTQHPILYTVFVGKLMDWGFSIDNVALGLFVSILLQTVLMLLVLAYTLHTMNKFHLPKWLMLLTLVFFAISPIFCSYATTAIIDGLYCSFFLLLMDELSCYLFSRGKFLRSWQHYVLTAAAVFGLSIRHNGLYISAGVFCAAVLLELFLFFKNHKKSMIALVLLVVLTVPALGGEILTNTLYEHYDARYISTRVMLSLPIQQVGRCMLYHGEEIDEEIIKDIQRVLEWEVEDYETAYRPLTFNGLKHGYNINADAADIAAFLKAWLKLVVKYPGTCFSATLNQTYALFSPKAVNQRYYRPTEPEIEILDYDFSSINDKSSSQKKAVSRLYRLYVETGYLPGLGLLVNQGFTNLVLLAAALYALLEKNGRFLFFTLPLLLTLGIAFLGPATILHPRYTYPIMYTLPLLIGLFMTTKKSGGHAYD